VVATADVLRLQKKKQLQKKNKSAIVINQFKKQLLAMTL
jgi:hypothetical protein